MPILSPLLSMCSFVPLEIFGTLTGCGTRFALLVRTPSTLIGVFTVRSFFRIPSSSHTSCLQINAATIAAVPDLGTFNTVIAVKYIPYTLA